MVVSTTRFILLGVRHQFTDVHPVQREGDKTVRLHVFEYRMKHLDDVLSFVEHVHGHIMVTSEGSAPHSLQPQSPPPELLVRPFEMQKMVKDTMEAALSPLLEALKVRDRDEN